MTLPQDAPIHQKGLTLLTRVEAYNTIADHFEEDFLTCGYRTHFRIADLLCEYYGPDKDVDILDVACGTGLVGDAMYKSGFRGIDGFDPAEQMLKFAKERNVYRNVRCHGLMPQQFDVPDCMYDAVTIGGYPNAPDTLRDGLPELLRILRTGGYLIITIRNMFYINEGFRTKFIPALQALEDAGKIKKLVENVYPDYFQDIDGILLMYRKEM